MARFCKRLLRFHGYNNRDHKNAKNANGQPASGPNRPEQTNATADIHVTPDGRFVYASNRGHDSIVGYSVGADGRLTLLGFTYVRGEHPRNFSIHPSGEWLLVANQDSGNIVVFKLDRGTGALTYANCDVPVKTARCIKWAVATTTLDFIAKGLGPSGNAQATLEEAAAGRKANNEFCRCC